MFAVNSYVVYRSSGVCEIVDIKKQKFSGMDERTYYILHPVYDSESSKIFVPADNPNLDKSMQQIISPDEVYRLIDSVADDDTSEWIEDDNKRAEIFRGIMENGDREQVLKMIGSIYNHSGALKKEGKKLHISDETIFKRAEKKIYDEFAVVLNIKPAEVLPLITQRIESRRK